MPDFEKLVGIYSNWPDGKLFDEYAKKQDYGPVAVRAMEKVLSEKGFMETIRSGGLNALIEKEQHEADIAEQAWVEDRPIRALDPAELLPNSDGVYAEATLLNKTKLRLGNKGKIRFFKEGEVVKMSLNYGSLNLGLEEPFRCNFLASKTVKRVNFFKTSEFYTLYIQIRTEDGEWITLYEDQLQFKKLPEGWELMPYNDSIFSSKYVFEYFNYEVQLKNLARLLRKV